MNDVVALNGFTTDARYHRDVNEIRREVLGSNFPTSTMVQARPELLLEISAIALYPEGTGEFCVADGREISAAGFSQN